MGSMMSADKFFPPRPDSKPTIYAYEDTNPQYRCLLKIGYTGINKHEGEDIGLYDTVLSTKDYHAIFENVAEKV